MAVFNDPKISDIKTKTDNLPVDPADASDVSGQISTAESNIRGADSDTLKTLSDQSDGIQSDTDDLQTQVGVAGAGLSAIPDMAKDSTVAKDATVAKDSTVAKEATLGSPVGASLSADIASVKGDVFQLPTLTSSTHTAGTFSYLDAGGEQDIFEFTIASKRRVVHGIWLDLVNMTQNGTVKFYYKIDGTNYREVTSFSFTVATDSDGLFIDLHMGLRSDFKVTYTEGADEGANRAIPFEVVVDLREI